MLKPIDQWPRAAQDARRTAGRDPRRSRASAGQQLRVFAADPAALQHLALDGWSALLLCRPTRAARRWHDGGAKLRRPWCSRLRRSMASMCCAPPMTGSPTCSRRTQRPACPSRSGSSQARKLVDVTRQHPDEVRADATGWWHLYREQRRSAAGRETGAHLQPGLQMSACSASAGRSRRSLPPASRAGTSPGPPRWTCSSRRQALCPATPGTAGAWGYCR